MLQQMLEDDKAESVRRAVVRSLGVLVAFVDDDSKFKKVKVIVLTLGIAILPILLTVLGVGPQSPQ